MAINKLKYKASGRPYFSFYEKGKIGSLMKDRIAAKECVQFLWIPIGTAYDYEGEPFENKAVILIYLN